MRGGTLRRVGVAMLCALAATAPTAAAEEPAPSITITSPLGRSGLPGLVRIVARVTGTSTTAPFPAVRFYVDGALLATDADGPPYVTEWADEDPFHTRRIRAEFDADPAGIVGDEVELKPFELVDTVHVLSVVLDAAVVDRGGRSVRDLATADFTLRENGIPQPLDGVSGEAGPAAFAILVDASQSMARNLGFVRSAAGRLPRLLRPDDSVTVAPFRNGIVATTGPTRDEVTIADAVAAIRAEGSTAILDALADVSGRFAEGPGRRIVVLITDGYDERSQGSPDEVLRRLKASAVTVYVVAVGGVSGVSLAGERLLRRLANETGGRAYFPWNQKELAEVHASIADDVRFRYRLTYTPTNQAHDGSWRAITVQMARPDLQVRARTGYSAPQPPPVRAVLEFTATDANRRYADLVRSDLEVYEDGVLQDVEVFTEAVAPVSIVLALDSSGSMTRVASDAREAAHAFVDAVRPLDSLAVMTFATHVQFAHDLGTDRQRSHDAVGAYETKGGTALHDAIVDAIDRLASVDGRRVIVVVTDGRDENAAATGPGSRRHWEAVLTRAREVDVTAYVIGLGSRIDRPRLSELARLTGGEAYFSVGVADLSDSYKRIIDELRRRYVLAYTSTNSARDGHWRTVEIKTPRGIAVRSRGGYSAPR